MAVVVSTRTPPTQSEESSLVPTTDNDDIIAEQEETIEILRKQSCLKCPRIADSLDQMDAACKTACLLRSMSMMDIKYARITKVRKIKRRARTAMPRTKRVTKKRLKPASKAANRRTSALLPIYSSFAAKKTFSTKSSWSKTPKLKTYKTPFSTVGPGAYKPKTDHKGRSFGAFAKTRAYVQRFNKGVTSSRFITTRTGLVSKLSAKSHQIPGPGSYPVTVDRFGKRLGSAAAVPLKSTYSKKRKQRKRVKKRAKKVTKKSLTGKL